jgi:hypothetical protein
MKDTTSGRLVPRRAFALAGVLLALALLGLAVTSSCSSEDAEPREIRAHTRVIEGVPHAEPAQRAERYCSHCHGVNLMGAQKGLEPSCYTCHGKNWLDDDPDKNWAPADHTLVNGERFYHHPDLMSPAMACNDCHGPSFEGQVTSVLMRPGCELCHERLWEAAD